MKDTNAYNKINRLLSLTKAGEDAAFDQIAVQYRPLIEGCVCYFANCAEADELEQEALIALYRAACTYDPEKSNVSFGLYAKICINNSLISLARNYIKQKSTCAGEDGLTDDFLYDELDPSADYINRESFDLLDKYVRLHLSEYEYSVFRLYIEGYKIKEISAKIHKSEKSVEGAVMRMRVKLRKYFSDKDL